MAIEASEKKVGQEVANHLPLGLDAGSQSVLRLQSLAFKNFVLGSFSCSFGKLHRYLYRSVTTLRVSHCFLAVASDVPHLFGC